MKAVIVSGVSGSGKSSWIKAQPWFDNASVHSADDFFIKDSTYQFDANKLDEAHSQCLRGFVEECKEAPLTTVLVVDNTNLASEEIAPYYSVARAYGYEVELITLHIDVYTAAERNAHGVSLRTIEHMYKKLHERRLPHFWKMVKSNYRWVAGDGDSGSWVKL